MIKPGEMWELIKGASKGWSDDLAPSMGAALAYYTVFSIAPLLLLLIALAGAIFGADAARGQIVAELGGMMGKEGASAIEGLLKSASQPEQSIVATIISVVTLLIGATTVFAELQSDLDRIWKAPAASRPSGIWGLLRARFLSFGMIISVGFLLIVSLALSAGLSALGAWWGPVFSSWAKVLQVINFVVSFAVTSAAFAVVYKIMPSVKIRWRDVWVGAAVTALLFTLGKYLIGLYIGKAGVASAFGAAGSLIVVLVWVYYSAQIFLLGAEFTAVYARTAGSHAGAGANTATGMARTHYERVAGEQQSDAPHNAIPDAGSQPGTDQDPVPMWPAVAAVASERAPLIRGLIRVAAALTAGWVFGYALKMPIQRQLQRLRCRS